MAYELTKNLKNALKQSSKDPQYILKIEGIDDIFGAVPVEVWPKYDDPGLYYDTPGLKYDRPFKSPNSKDWIDMGKSTNSVQQQIEPDKGAGTSTSQMTFEIVDLNQQMSYYISPGFHFDEILGKKATVYFTIKGGTGFPVDTIVLFHGFIEEVIGLPGSVRITVSHPQNLLRQDFLPPWSATLVDYFHYRSEKIQDILYLARIPDGLIVQIQYVNAGSASVSVSGNQITVYIVAGVTTADDIKNLIENTTSAVQLVELDIVGTGTNIQTATGGYINLGDSTILKVDSVEGLIGENADLMFKTHIKINDEILRVTSINTVTNEITVDISQRSLFKSNPPKTSEPEDEVNSFYVLEGNALEMALKLILSGADPTVASAKYFGKVPGLGYVTNAVFFSGINIEEETSVVLGDTISMNPVFTNRTVVQIVNTEYDSYLIVSGADIGNGDGPYDVSIVSKYDTLPTGCAVEPVFVDISRFEQILSSFSSSIPDYRFYITDSINMKEFLEQEIFFPAALYMCPRKGRISCAIAKPAIGSSETITLNESNVLEPETRAIVRSTNQNFYNAINYYFDVDCLDDANFTRKIVTVNSDSVQRFKRVGVRPLVIESKGLRSDLNAENMIELISRRFLDRYKFGAEAIQVAVNLEVGAALEIADTVIYGQPEVQIPDITQGSRSFQPRVWEIINRELNITRVNLTLLETKYGINGRFGMVSPNSIIGSGSTVSEVVILPSYGTGVGEVETDKWTDYIGQKLLIRSKDWSSQQECLLVGINTAGGFKLLVDGLGLAPNAGDIVDLPTYDDSNQNANALYKAIFCFFDPTVTVVSGISNTQFTVSAPDAAKFYQGLKIRVHSQDYSIDSGDVEITVANITGTTITASADIGFTPSAGQRVDFIGFTDGGKPYMLI